MEIHSLAFSCSALINLESGIKTFARVCLGALQEFFSGSSGAGGRPVSL